MRHHLANALACSALLGATSISAQPEQSMAKLVDELSSTAAAGDERGKLAAYRKMAKLLAEDSSNQNLHGLFIQADLQRDIARAVYSIGADDPCNALDQGMIYLGQARAILPKGEKTGETEALDDIEQRFTAERRRMRCSPLASSADLGKPDAALVGHYYLSGVMETGSELLLKADGRFDWYISYGAVDQIAKGRWGRLGKAVTLVADQPAADAPLFRADEVFPWDEAAEREQREYKRGQQMDLITARCPWNVSTAKSLWSYTLEDRPPAGADELARASRTKLAAETARHEASRKLAAATAKNASDADRAAADAAMAAWYSAQAEMEQAHHDANLPEPDIGEPDMPSACQQPADDTYEQIPEADWRRGVGVVVGDPARELRFSRVDVTFVFADGHRETTKTRRGGFAFAPIRESVEVNQLVLSIQEPVVRSETLSIKPMTDGIQAVIVDTQQIVEPAFSDMRLVVEGKDLIPQNMPRGRYSRN